METLVKSNQLITAKYQSTLIENQVMAIALTRIEKNINADSDKMEAVLFPNELKQIIGDPSHIYRTLKTVSKTMTGHNMLIEDGNGNFKAFAIVTNAEYIDGVFTVKFNEKLKEHILGLEKNFTTLELSILTSFKKNASYRLYELFKREMYKSNPKIEEGRVEIEYSISELKFMIGLANIDDQKVRNDMARMGTNIDWDRLYSILDSKDRKYDSWSDFQKYVIRVAQQEFEEISNLRFDYQGIREGRSMKRIKFQVFPNDAYNQVEKIKVKEEVIKNVKSNENLQLLENIYIGHNNLTKQNIKTIYDKADGDIELAKYAISMADKQPYLRNYVGWILSCIERGFEENQTIYGDNERANVVQAVNDNLKSNEDQVAIKVWEKIKTKNDYNEFVQELYNEFPTLDLTKIELLYEPADLTEMYFSWKINRKIELK